MRLLALFALALISAAVLAKPSKSDDDRMKWWREARLGMFIHWGLYSIPAGKAGNETGHGEWIRDTAHIPVGEYEKYRDQFNPVNFDAEKWVQMAKKAGMKYIVITTKHHDGFDLFDTAYGDWNIMHTPFHRDVMKELAEACQRNGLKMCWYHSIMDWHHPDYLPRRPWEVAQRPEDGAKFENYVQYLRNQVTELLTKYGLIGVMWFDGEWEATWNDKYGRPLYDLCRKLQPNVIVNNRVSNNREGSMEDAAGKPTQIGDFTTPEQYIPATGMPGVDWETCMTMNDHWGYNAYDKKWKSSTELIRNIVDIASKGGNYLLNVGPTSLGDFPPEAVDRLAAIGNFMDKNGESIYGTTASVFDNLPWGRSTTKSDGSDTILYLHVFEWPTNGELVVPGIGNEPLSASVPGMAGIEVPKRRGSDIVIHVPSTAPSDIDTVVTLAIKGRPIVYRTPKIVSGSDIFVHSAKVTIESGSKDLEVRYTTDGSDPTSASTVYTSPFEVRQTVTVRSAAFVKGERVSSVATGTFQKVSPAPAQTIKTPQPGFVYSEYEGKWDTMPDFNSLSYTVSGVISSLNPPALKGVPKENVGRVYSAFLNVPLDDVYTFNLTSDDGSKMYVDGKLVVDNDGLHSSETKSGHAALAKGFHTIVIQWFNRTGGAALEVTWGRIGAKMQKLTGNGVGHLEK